MVSGMLRAALAQTKKSIRWLLLLISTGIIIGGCTPTDQNYMREGIGARLAISIEDASENARLQDHYFAYLCQQAGFAPAGSAYVQANSASFSPACWDFSPDAEKWTLVVYQGMNDIDRRCDGYLEWLDLQRRSKDKNINLWDKTKSRTTTIIGLGWPESTFRHTALAINLVGEAFGLIGDYVENYYSRLIVAAEHSTITSVVYGERDRFRREIYDKKLLFGTRPDAEHALRQYLRICLPMTIEAQINDLSTLGSRDITPTRRQDLLQSPATVPSFAVIPRTSQDFGQQNNQQTQIAVTQDDPNVVAIFGKKSGRTIESVIGVQRRLCVPPIGKVGPQTRTAIAIMRRQHTEKPETDGEGPIFPTQAELDMFLANPHTGVEQNGYCDTTKFINTYEAESLSTRTALNDFINKFNEAVPDDLKFADPALVKVDSDPASDFRKKIAAARTLLAQECSLNEVLEDGRAHVTFHFDAALFRSSRGLCS